MAYARYTGNHPEPSLSLPDLGDGPSRPWPFRGASGRNAVYAFPRGVERRVPALVAGILCALRRREGPWWTVRLEPGEWQALAARAHGLIPPPALPTRPDRRDYVRLGEQRLRPEAKRRYRSDVRRWRARRRAALQAHARRGLKVRDLLNLLQPSYAAQVYRGLQGRYEVGNAAGWSAVHDPLLGSR